MIKVQMRIVRRRPWKKILALFVFVLILVSIYVYWALNRTLPSIAPTPTALPSYAKTSKPSIAWPANAQSAASVIGTSVSMTNGQQKPVPTASVAKVITSLVVLEKKPLKKGEQGPMITINAADVARYQTYTAQDGSVVPVKLGEQISEYQALQTILLPSANNMADTLAIWAYGSIENYTKAANTYLAAKGLNDTKVGKDASGLSPDTVSTASDLVRLGKLAMANEVIAEIVAQPSADNIPVAGTIKNVNFLLGTDGIVGIKTGNSDQAGGVYLAAANFKVNDKTAQTVTAVAGSPSLFASMKSSLSVIDSVKAGYKPSEVVRQGDQVAVYKLPWGGSVSASSASALKLSTWGGSSPATKLNLRSISPESAKVGQTVGSLNVPATATNNNKQVSVKLSQAVSKPSGWWRVTHPLGQ